MTGIVTSLPLLIQNHTPHSNIIKAYFSTSFQLLTVTPLEQYAHQNRINSRSEDIVLGLDSGNKIILQLCITAHQVFAHQQQVIFRPLG